jgi:hypothetical protein
MATVWKSNGTIGHEDSTDRGTEMPLNIVEERLRDFKLFYQGESPKVMLPRTKYFTHVVISVTDIDHPRPERFERPGFYQVVGLRLDDAAFLFEPYLFVPFDARAKEQVADLPVDAFVVRDPVADDMTIAVRFRDAPQRNNIKHSKPVRSADDNEAFVDRVVGEFLSKNGIEKKK